MDANGHPESCDQPSGEMADLMAKALEDIDQAELFVWQGYDEEARHWLLRHALNILECCVIQRAMCHYVTNYGDCGAVDMALGR